MSNVTTLPKQDSPFTVNGIGVDEAQFQVSALTIDSHVVIEACAGSGKTWLLTARILKLLLAGVAPNAILAITFTRKATQEMKQRLADMLNVVGDLTHQDRAFTLKSLYVDDTDTVRAQIQHMRQQAFELGQWPQIVTFHEWFSDIRKAAPYSLQTAPAAVLTEDEHPHIQRAWQAFWQATTQDAHLSEQLRCGVQLMGLNAFESAMKALFNRRTEWQVYVQSKGDQAFTVEQAHQAFVSMLQVRNLDDIREQFLATVHTMRDWPRYFAQASKTKTALQRADALIQTFERLDQQTAGELNASGLWAYVEGFLEALSNKNHALPSLKNRVFADMRTLLNQQFAGGEAGFAACYEDIHGQLLGQLDALHTLRMLPAHRAALHCAQVLMKAYQHDKLSHSVVDFSDLEFEALKVLQATQGQYGARDLPWTQTQHVLVDEFQDTNPIQWQALQAFLLPLLQEVQAGGQAGSLFIVGDPKQSIYRFRRADPALFGHVAHWLQSHFGAVILRTQRTRRNTQVINALVNAVFVEPERVSSIFSKQYTLNLQQGHVQLMAPAKGALAQNADDLDLQDEPISGIDFRSNILTQAIDGDFSQVDTHAQEAHQIARQMLQWKQANPDTPWSNVMVLARNRQPLGTLDTVLRSYAIPCSNDAKGGFFVIPQVADVLALLSALHAPQDAVSTLHALRSPIFGISQTQLNQLLVHWHAARSAKTIGSQVSLTDWCGLATLGQPWAERCCQWLLQWRQLACNLPTHDALDAILHKGRIVQRMIAAAPSDREVKIRAAMQQLLQTALDVQGGRYPSLAGFIHAVGELRASDAIAAQSAVVPDAVRLSTIHSAKGLEADLVIMMDCFSKGGKDNAIEVMMDWSATAGAPTSFGLSLEKPWAGAVAQRFYEQIKQASDLEKHTVLYVAITRAKQALWVTGTFKKNVDSIYHRLEASLKNIPTMDPQLAPSIVFEAQATGDTVNLEALDKKEQALLPPFKLDLVVQLPNGRDEQTPLWCETPPNIQVPAPYIEDHVTQRGKALHSALHSYLQYGSLPNALTLLQRSTLPLSLILEVLLDAQQMIDRLQLSKLRDHEKVEHILAERTWLDLQVQIQRPDVVVLGDGFTWLLDYKAQFHPQHVSAQNYADQLARYAGCLPNDVHRYILTTQGQCWRWLDTPASEMGVTPIQAHWHACKVPWADVDVLGIDAYR